MEFFNKHKMLILIALGVLVVLGIWWGFSREAPSDSLLTTEVSPETDPSDRGLVDTLLQLRAVSLSGTIFSDPAFMSLQDFGTQIIPEPVGRPNPFAPVSSNAKSTTTSGSRGTQLFPSGRP